MPKLKRNEYESYHEYEGGVPPEHEHLVKYLQTVFGIPKHMIEYHPCAGDESIFIRYKGNSFWLFEVDEETHYDKEEWHSLVLRKLNNIYSQMEEIMDYK